MAQIRDDVFLNASMGAPTSAPRKLSAADLAELKGIGDARQREADDLLLNAGLGISRTPMSDQWKPGQPVSFVTPDGVSRVGALTRQASNGSDWLVQTDEGSFSLVPVAELHEAPQAVQAEVTAQAFKAALVKPINLRVLRAAQATNDAGTDHSVVLAFDHAQRPTDDDVVAFIAQQYGDHVRVLDAELQPHGRVAVVFTSSVAPSERQPGLFSEETEGDATSISTATMQDELVQQASKHPSFTWHVTGARSYLTEAGERAAQLDFELIDPVTDLPLHIDGQTVTATLSETSVPAVGYIRRVGSSATTKLYGAEGEFELTAQVSEDLDVGDLWNRGLSDFHDVDGALGDLAKKSREFNTAPRSLFEAALKEITAYLNYGELDESTDQLLIDVAAEIKEILDGASQREASDAYESGQGPESSHEDEPAGFENGSYVVTAEDLEVEAAPKMPPLDQVDYRREKERYDTQQSGADEAAAKAKERRKLRNLERNPVEPQQPAQPGLRTVGQLTDDNKEQYEQEWQVGRSIEEVLSEVEFLLKEMGKVPSLLRVRDKLQTLLSQNKAASSTATDEEDGEVREVLVPSTNVDFKNKTMPMQTEGSSAHQAVDETAKEYWEEFLGEYGEDLTSDVPRRKHQAQGVPVTQLVEALTAGAQQGIGTVKDDVSKAISRFISSGNAVDALKRVDNQNTVLPLLIYAAMSDQSVSRLLGQSYAKHKEQLPISGYRPTTETPKPTEQQMGPYNPGEFGGDTMQTPTIVGAARKQANPLCAFKLDSVATKGDYIHANVVWDPDACVGMGDANIRHSVLSFIKGEATKKEGPHGDLGTIGEPVFIMFDPDAGLAELKFRSSEARAQTPTVITE